jgi:hypothetical protein
MFAGLIVRVRNDQSIWLALAKKIFSVCVVVVVVVEIHTCTH